MLWYHKRWKRETEAWGQCADGMGGVCSWCIRVRRVPLTRSLTDAMCLKVVFLVVRIAMMALGQLL